MLEFLEKLLDTSDFPARWHCGVWTTAHGWLHILSDLGVWSAYLAIPFLLGYFIWRKKQLAFRRVFILFGAFIFACGTTHLMEALIFWWPAYRLAGLIKLVSAVISWATVLALVRLIPSILSMRSAGELEREILERKRAEEQLVRQTDELSETQESLRRRSTLLQSIINNMGEGLVVADETGKFLQWNPAAEKILGLGLIDVPPDGWAETYGLFQADQVTPCPTEDIPLARAIRGHDVDDVELFVRNAQIPDGAWILVTGRPLRDDKGALRGGIVVFCDVTVIRSSQEILRHHEQQLQEACRIARLGYWEYDVARCTFTFTDSFYDLLGTSAEKENGYQMAPEVYASRYLHPDDGHVVATELGKAIASREMNYFRELVARLVTTDSQTRHVLVRFRLVRDAQGQPLRLVGANQDITQRILAEKALRESEERFRLAIINAPFPILLHAEDGEVIQVGQAWTEITGYNADEIRTTADWTELAYGQRKELVKADIDRLYGLETRRQEGEYVITTRGGEQRIWDFSSSPLGPLPDGRRLVISMAMDVTRRKQAEEQLRQLNVELEQRVQERTAEVEVSWKQFRTIFEEAPLGIALIDSLTGHICDVNPQFASIVGRTREEMATIDWMSITPTEDVQEDLDNMTALNAGKLPGFTKQKRYRRPDGSYVWINMTIAPITVQDTRCPRHLCMIENVTERKKAETALKEHNVQLDQRTAQLETANKELEAFSYSVSHDLRAPLRAIDGFSRILLTEHSAVLPESARGYLDDVRRNTQKMGRLIDDLLTFSRTGRQALSKQTIQPERLVQTCLEELRDEQKDRHIEIVIGNLPPCQADPALLKQVWINLLANALKYTRKTDPARIDIGCQTHDNESGVNVYFVRDNGVGFDMNYAHKLFGVFQRLHRSSEYEGTGVGLAIVQRIVRRHGGDVWAQAELNKGATFSFTLEGGSIHA